MCGEYGPEQVAQGLSHEAWGEVSWEMGKWEMGDGIGASAKMDLWDLWDL